MKKIGQIYREQMIQDIKKGLELKDNALILRYSKVSAADLDTLRKQLKQQGARLFVTRNVLTKMALKKIDLEDLGKYIDGPTALILGMDDPISVFKTITKFTKDHVDIKVEAGFLGERILKEEDLNGFKGFSSKKDLQAVAVHMIGSPLSNFVGILSQRLRELIFILKQLSEKKK